MRAKSSTPETPSERLIRGIRRATRKQYSAEEKIRIVLDGLRGEVTIAELCRREGIAEGLYYSWSKESSKPASADWLVTRPERRPAADKSFVAFNDLAFAADRAVCASVLAHRFANAHRQKPRAFVRDAKHPLQLLAGHAFLTGGHQVIGQYPLGQRDLGTLHH